MAGFTTTKRRLQPVKAAFTQRQSAVKAASAEKYDHAPCHVETGQGHHFISKQVSTFFIESAFVRMKLRQFRRVFQPETAVVFFQ